MKKIDFFFGTMLIVGLCVLSFVFGMLLTQHVERKNAIKAGAGHYTVEPTTGQVTFQYKSNENNNSSNHSRRLD